MFYHGSGAYNTAVGEGAIQNATVGDANTAVGFQALISNNGGTNIALGYAAGGNLVAGRNNIYIGNLGAGAENGTIYLGTTGIHTNTRIAGIYGANSAAADAAPVYVAADGQLVTGGMAGFPGAVVWRTVWVTSDPVQAQPNRGYLAVDSSLTTITLPASANLNLGDIVRVSGVGSGGWRIAQESDQSILSSYGSPFSAPPGVTWTARDSARAWGAVASSADGTKLVAAVHRGQIYTSTDSGVTWTARDSARNWYAVASSADGTKLVAAEDGGQIYTSTSTSVTSTTPGTKGFLTGQQTCAIELQYMGNGQFMPLSYAGSLIAY